MEGVEHACIHQTSPAGLQGVNLIFNSDFYAALQQHKNLQFSMPVGHDRPGDKLVDIAVMRAQSEGLHTGFQHFFPVWGRADGVFIENQITTLFVVIIIV